VTGRQRLVIAGDGLAAWMTAAALVRALNPAHRPIVVVSIGGGPEDSSVFGRADATLPTGSAWHPALELDEGQLVATTGGGFSLGIALTGWARPGSTWFQPFSAAGAALGPVPFHHVVSRLRQTGASARLADYSLAALAAQAGRFQRPGRDPREVLSTCRYGLHLDCATLARGLQVTAEAAGARRATGILTDVERAPDGGILALRTSDGERIEGTLFLDCTGGNARLIGTAPTAAWRDWSRWLPCDRALSATFATDAAPAPYSHAEADSAGWTRQVPLQGRVQLTRFYRSDLLDDERALAGLQGQAGGAPGAPKAGPVAFGRREVAWHRNCVALGEAAVVIDPVAASNLHLLRVGIDRLLKLLPAGSEPAVEAAEYNRQTAAQYDNARDFALLHYKLNGRPGEALWEACRAIPLPAALDYRLRLFEARGRVALYDEEGFEEADWVNLLDGHGVRPRRHSPIADGLTRREAEAHLERVRGIMLDTLRGMPTHADYLAALHGTMPAKGSGRPPGMDIESNVK